MSHQSGQGNALRACLRGSGELMGVLLQQGDAMPDFQETRRAQNATQPPLVRLHTYAIQALESR
jgi:hypothetical protein